MAIQVQLGRPGKNGSIFFTRRRLLSPAGTQLPPTKLCERNSMPCHVPTSLPLHVVQPFPNTKKLVQSLVTLQPPLWQRLTTAMCVCVCVCVCRRCCLGKAPDLWTTLGTSW